MLAIFFPLLHIYVNLVFILSIRCQTFLYDCYVSLDYEQVKVMF